MGSKESTVGLRELRQNASELLRTVEAGEEISITVAGRQSARLVAAHPKTWRTWDDVADLFDGPADDDWERDRDLLGELAISAATVAELHCNA